MTDPHGNNPSTAPIASGDPHVVRTGFGVDPGLQFTGVGAVSRMSDNTIISRGVQLIETERLQFYGKKTRRGQDDARRMNEIWLQIYGALGVIKPDVLSVEAYTTRIPQAWENLKLACSRLIQLRVPASYAEFMTMLGDQRIAGQWMAAIGAIAKCLRDSEGFDGMGLGHAAKSIGVQWIAACAAWAHGVPVYVYTPTQLKMFACGRANASKEDVGLALESRIMGLAEHSATIRARTIRENPKSLAALDRVSHVHDAVGHALMGLTELESSLGVNT